MDQEELSIVVVLGDAETQESLFGSYDELDGE